jgi:hypothetical protein
MGQVPVPAIDEMAESPGFLPVEISADDFEEIRRKETADFGRSWHRDERAARHAASYDSASP